MADLTITAASVVAGSDATLATGTAGATITAGQVIYLDTSTSTLKLADSDSSTAAVRSPIGIALHASLSGQPLTYAVLARGGTITIGATMTAGLTYFLSKTAGGICPVADIASGGYPVIVLQATSTTVAKMLSSEAGVAV